MEKRFVYADNAATTKVSQSVLDAMTPYLTEHYGNASSVYSIARTAKRAIEEARGKVAAALGAEPREIYFTSCGTESDNWAIKGAALRLAAKGKKHIVTSSIEHHAVLHTCEYLEKQGFEVTYLPVDGMGLVSPEQVEQAIRPDTALVTIMYANNEIGTIQPVAEIGKICRDKGVLFHTDAVQAVGNLAIDVKEQNIDLLSLSGHKIHAPKGIGALYIRKGVAIDNFMHGGGQESGKRGGTENTAYIVGLGQAVEDAVKGLEAKAERLTKRRDRMIDGILKIPVSRLNGDPVKRLCGNVNVSFEAVEGEALLLRLDLKGVCGSSGSACTSGSLDPSHVLLAIGLPHEIAHGSLRLTLSEETTQEEIDVTVEAIKNIVERLRAMSPLYEDFVKAQKQD